MMSFPFEETYFSVRYNTIFARQTANQRNHIVMINALREDSWSELDLPVNASAHHPKDLTHNLFRLSDFRMAIVDIS